MATHLDLDAWPRREQFDFFRTYDQPYFNVCVPVDVTELLDFTRSTGRSFFLTSLYLSLAAANETEPFRYRLDGDRVRVYERIHGGSTVLLPDNTFTFAYFDFTEDFVAFEEKATDKLEWTYQGSPDFDPRDDADDLIHYSVLPWLSFTSFSHARRRDPNDSIPKISFGKYTEDGEGRWKMPVSVAVHHALMDGFHVGRFVDRFQAKLAEPETVLGR